MIVLRVAYSMILCYTAACNAIHNLFKFEQLILNKMKTCDHDLYYM